MSVGFAGFCVLGRDLMALAFDFRPMSATLHLLPQSFGRLGDTSAEAEWHLNME